MELLERKYQFPLKSTVFYMKQCPILFIMVMHPAFKKQGVFPTSEQRSGYVTESVANVMYVQVLNKMPERLKIDLTWMQSIPLLILVTWSTCNSSNLCKATFMMEIMTKNNETQRQKFKCLNFI